MDDGLRLDVAPFIAALEKACGRRALVLGKPSLPFFQSALRLLKMDARETLMVGDDIQGDVNGAQQAGIDAILVRTGKFREQDLQQGIKPRAILNSVADLPEWYQRRFTA